MFVGREEPLRFLHGALDEVRSRNPRLVLVDGPAGIGKTSLINQFARTAHVANTLYVSGEETEARLAFGVIQQLTHQVDMHLVSELNTAGHEPSARTNPVSVGASLLGLLDRAQENGPVVLLIDDVESVDAPSLHALTFAFRRLRVDRVMVVMTARNPVDPWLTDGLHRLLTGPAGMHLPLTGLDADDVRSFCRCASNLILPPRAASRLRDHTGGNPLYLRALIDELPAPVLRDSGLSLRAPRSFARMVDGAVARCEPDTRKLVVAAATLGVACPLSLARELSGLDDLSGAFDGAVAAGLLEEARPGMAAFPNPLIRAAIYHSVGPGQRARLHSHAAILIEDPTVVLSHRVAACPGGDVMLAAEIEDYARRQASSGNWSAAAEHFRAAVRLYTCRTDRDRCVLKAADCLLQAGEVAEVSVLRDDLEGCGDGPWRQYLLGYMTAAAGQLDVAVELLERAWAQCNRRQERELAARIAAVRARVASLATPGHPMVHWACRALRMDPEAAHAANALDTLLSGLGQSGHPRLGLDLAQRLSARRNDGRPGALDGLIGTALLCLWTDDLRGAISRLTVAVDAYRRHGPADLAVTSCVALAEAHWRAGTWDDAALYGELAVSLADDAEQHWLAPLSHARAAYPHIGRGHWEEAENHLRAGRIESGLINPYPAVWAREVEGFLALARGEPVKACTILELLQSVMGDRLDRLGNQPGVMEWRDTYAEALTALERYQEAERILRPLEELAQRHGRRSAIVAAARARGSLESSRGHHEAAEMAFRAGLAHAQGLQRPFSVARLELAYGCFLRRTGQRALSAAQLEKARHRLQFLGAGPWLEICERELAACGRIAAGTPTAVQSTLTSQELAVSRLVCQGLTNKQIARQLVVSVKTIEYHLGKVYTKLGLRSRTQLALWVVDD
jgi:ATP/maltotriose-dependent transcriptional regulator MalT